MQIPPRLAPLESLASNARPGFVADEAAAETYPDKLTHIPFWSHWDKGSMLCKSHAPPCYVLMQVVIQHAVIHSRSRSQFGLRASLVTTCAS